MAALAAATAGVLLAVAAPASAAAPTGRYVALGDSYTSGPLIPTQVDLNCLRSNRNYPSLVAASAGSSSFADVSCSRGHHRRHPLRRQRPAGHPVPPQINAVTVATALVTVQIGGNDIGFSGIISDCAEASLEQPARLAVQEPVHRRRHRPVAGPDRRHRAEGGRRAAGGPPAAPSARVVVLGYPAILPDTGYGCWPVVPIAYRTCRTCAASRSRSTRCWPATAAANGATYADAYTPSIGHDACKSSGTRWVEGLVPQNSAAPFHPNARGEQGMATALLARLNS